MTLEEIKPGDWVALYNGNIISKEQVTRITKARIFIGDYQFNKKDGNQYGKYSFYKMAYIKPWSKEVEQEIAERQAKWKRAVLVHKIKVTNFHSLDMNELKDIAAKLGIKVGE